MLPKASGTMSMICAIVLATPGGATATEVRADTWRWRAGSWRRAPLAGPDPRTFPVMAYDSVRDEVVLFGGRFESSDGHLRRLGDTWEWDGERWPWVSTTGPSPRSGAAMAYHPGLEAVVLFGGSGGPLGDTWSWNGRAWTPLAVPPAPGRVPATMPCW